MKNKGLLRPGVTKCNNEAFMRTHLDKRNGTYYYRRVVPEELRPYFRTKTGKPRTEFMISLRTKERSVAEEQLEREAVRVTALLKEARRKLNAGLVPTSPSAIDSAAFDRWQLEQLNLQKEAFRFRVEQEATEAEEDAALANDMNRPYEELSSYERAIRRNLQPELFDSETIKAQREQIAAINYETAGKAFSEAVEKFGIEGALKPRYPRLMEIFDSYVIAAQHTA